MPMRDRSKITTQRRQTQRIVNKASSRIALYSNPGRAAFFSDTNIQDAILFNLSAVAYAAELDEKAFSEVSPPIDISFLRRIRDPLAILHKIVDLDEVWQFASQDIPRLGRTLNSQSEVNT